MNTVIKTVALTKEYKQGTDTISAVKDINLEIEQGEMVSVVGRSGSGKSTLLNMLGGIDVPTSGEIKVLDTSILNLSDLQLTRFRRKHISMIFQNYYLVNELNVLENIRLPLDIAGLKYDISYERELVSLLELDSRLKFRPFQLSGGQQQRVAIARALITRPEIVLADEPTGNLDKKTGDAFFDYLVSANKTLGQTYVIVTHNQELAQKTNRIITIDDGRITDDLKQISSSIGG